MVEQLIQFLRLRFLDRRQHKLRSIPDRMARMNSQANPGKFLRSEALDHVFNAVMSARRTFRPDA